MPEADPAAVAHQHAALLGFVEGGAGVLGVLAQCGDRRGGDGILLGGGEQQHRPHGGRRQLPQQRFVGEFQSRMNRQRVRQSRCTQPLGGVQPLSDRRQRERVALRLVDQASQHTGRQSLRQHLRSRSRRQAGQRNDVQTAQRHRRLGSRPHREEERHGVVPHPASSEQQSGRRFAVCPVQVVDDHEQRLRIRGGGEQRQGGRGDQIAVTRGSGGPCRRPPAECRSQRIRLRVGQVGHEVLHGRQHLEQRGMAESGLGLDPPCPQTREPIRSISRCFEEGRLADAGLALEDERTGRTVSGAVDEPLDPAQLLSPADEPDPCRSGCPCGD